VKVSKDITVLFCGDFAPCRGYESLVLERGEGIFGDALPIIKSADISFVNLECVLTNHDEKINKSGPALKAEPLCIEALKSFDVVGLANNHIMDYGNSGLLDTMELCIENNISTVGAGLTLEDACKVLFKESQGVKIAIIALAEFEFNQSVGGGAGSAPIDLISNYHQIEFAKKKADVVIVTIHGGNEYFPYPSPEFRRTCQHFINLGVDAVICHHPHVPGAYEYYKEKPIIYSLGNVIFDSVNAPKDWELGYIASLKVDSDSKIFKSLELIPYTQSVKQSGMRVLKGSEKETILKRVEEYRDILSDNAKWLAEWEHFILLKSNNYIVNFFSPVNFKGLGFLARHTPIARLFFNQKKDRAKLNMLRCQSHREVLINSLENKCK